MTDVVLAVVALGIAVYVWRMGKGRDRWKAMVWAWAFGLLTVASVLGAIAHGFKMSSALNDLLWQPLNLALGLTIGLFVVGVIYDLWGYAASRRWLPILIIIGVAFFAVTRLIPGSFLVFILYEAAAMVFALCVYAWLAARRQLGGAGWMALGILITIVAAGIQASEAVSLTLIWAFDHNGIFHIVQLVGVIVLAAGLRAAMHGPVKG